VAEIAARQHGVVTVGQLAAAGLGPHAVALRARHAWLTRLHRGVYLVGPAPGQWGLEAAALLGCGGRAALSHRSAAALWQMLPRPDGAIDVSVFDGHRRPRRGIRVHRLAGGNKRDITRRHDLRVTTPARTLLDLAASDVGSRDLESALNEALVQSLTSLPALHSYLARSSSLRGVARLRTLLATDPGITRSAAERALRSLIRKAGLPAPHTNVTVAGWNVDCWWPDLNLVVEVDGFGYHATPRAFARDRRRDADLQTAGQRVLRLSRWEVVREPEATIARVAGAVASAGGRAPATTTPRPQPRAARPP
jgi:very-short-patch-repair endonuclease